MSDSILDYLTPGTIEPKEEDLTIKKVSISPFDYVNDITHGKQDIIRNSEMPEVYEAQYNPWIVNKTLSYYQDTVEYANEMNRYAFLPNQMQFDYLLHSINKRKQRFQKQTKKVVTDEIKAIAKYFGYSLRRAEYSLKYLTEEQIEEIKKKVDPGGV